MKEVIDCAVHVYPSGPAEIKRYLSQPWKHRFHMWENTYYSNPVPPSRTVAPDGGRPGSHLDFLRKQLFEEQGVTTALLLPKANVSLHHNPDQAAVEASAYNQWLSETWLGEYNADGAFKGSITIAHQDPQQAADEIERWAEHEHFVQVVMDSGARAPFGQRHYHPIYAACNKHQIPLAIQPGTDGMGINILASQGYPSHYYEWYAGFSLAMQGHLISLLTEGVFERFPDLKIVITEGGFAWLPALMWRMDQEYKGLRSEVPWVKKPLSQYLQDHIWFTTQPLERPSSNEDLMKLLSTVDYENLLLYSSGYPDEFFASPESLGFLSEGEQKKILSENAKQLYRL